MVAGEKPNSRELLSEVDTSKIEQALSRSKDGLPQPFVCTNEPIEEKHLAKMPYKDKRKLWEIYDRLKEFREKSDQELPKLMELRKKYPNVPAIYNYIGLAYANTRQQDEYYQSIIETYKKFPNYLFGRISAAEYCINNNRHKEVPTIFDNKLEIYMHYPETVKVFHISEVRAFYSTLGIYYARSKKTARAIFSYMILNKVEPEHWATQKLADEIIFMETVKLQQEMLRNSRYEY
jgi:tetratricopeptide (TPR) repeat protein